MRESLDICSAAAASSVELEVDCCTSSRIRSIERTTACAPEACSSTEDVISCVISVSRLVALAICAEPLDCSMVACADFLREFVDFRDHVGDFVERQAKILIQNKPFLNHGRALVHVVDSFARLLLDALDQVGNFLGGLRGFFRELADFLGDDGESKAVFAGARRFDRGVERQQVGLLGEIVDHFDDLADVVGALSENVDDFGRSLNRMAGAVETLGGLVHRGHAGAGLFARTV